MLRLDGEVAPGALGVVCVLLVAPLGCVLLCVPLWVLLWAKALPAVDGSTSNTPPNKTADIWIGRNFIKTLFPAWRSAPRAWLWHLRETVLPEQKLGRTNSPRIPPSGTVPEDALFVKIHRLDAEELCCLSQFLFDPQ
jgi:hypothetical protein